MNSHIRQKIAEESENQPKVEEAVIFEINPAVTIDPDRLQTVLLQYANDLKGQNKMNLASILENGESTLTHNKWRFSIESDLLKDMIDREQDLLPYLRKELGVPDLIGEYYVKEPEQGADTKIPYTNEEKLLEMGKKNPTLEQMQKIFNTRIIYD